MDPIATLLLARTHTVVLDADRVASAATRPARDADVDRFEDELLQLGFVLSLDLAMTLRRLPHEALADLRAWMIATLANAIGVQLPQARGTAQPDQSAYARRALAWLHARPHQPCPWCAQVTAVRPLDPCGHLVCPRCWRGGNFAGCPICHRRVALQDPFLPAAPGTGTAPRHDGQLAILHLAFDRDGIAQARFERLLARATPLSKGDRDELETLIDTIGPKVAAWIPKWIPIRETAAIVLARLWLIAPEPRAMMRATHDHVKTATDVLRIASVLMRGNAALAEPMRLASVPRRLRRAVLEALEQLPADALVEDMRRHRGLWKRVGERLHPGEHVRELPNVAAAFAAVRGKPAQTTWAGRVEATLASGDARAAAALLRQRPDELLRRADHLARVAAARQPAAIDDATAALRDAASAGAPAALLQLAAHAARRTAPWPRRVFFPHGDVLRAYGIPDARAPLAPDLADAIVATTRSELLARAAARRNYARAVLDRELGDLPVTGGTRRPSKATLAWPRGSELALPGGDPLRLVLEGDRELTLVMFDDHWRHVRTCSDPAHVDLDVAELRASGARHVVAVVSRGGALAPDRFVGLGQAPAADAPFDPRAVATRFDLYGRAPLAVPLAIDLATRRVRWLDVRINDRGALARAGGYRAMLAHVGRDFADLAAPRARPTLWDVAAIHAAARANTIYVRDGGAIALYRRRDDEPHLARLARLHAGEHDGVSKIPPANAPTWFAVLRADVLLPKGSEGFVLDPRTLTADGVTSLAAADLVAALAKT